MFRFIISAVALAGIAGMAPVALAEPRVAAAFEQGQAAAAMPHAPAVPALPGPDRHDADSVPVGPGWG